MGGRITAGIPCKIGWFKSYVDVFFFPFPSLGAFFFQVPAVISSPGGYLKLQGGGEFLPSRPWYDLNPRPWSQRRGGGKVHVSYFLGGWQN